MITYTRHKLSDGSNIIAEGNNAVFFNGFQVGDGMPVLTWDSDSDSLIRLSKISEGDTIIIKGTESQYDGWGYQRAPVVVKSESGDLVTLLQK